MAGFFFTQRRQKHRLHAYQRRWREIYNRLAFRLTSTGQFNLKNSIYKRLSALLPDSIKLHLPPLAAWEQSQATKGKRVRVRVRRYY